MWKRIASSHNSSARARGSKSAMIDRYCADPPRSRASSLLRVDTCEGAHDLNHRGADDHAHHRRENKKHERKEDLDGGFGGRFFSSEAAGSAHRVRDRAQCGPYLRTELFALHQRSGERLDVVDCCAIGETPERLTKRA